MESLDADVLVLIVCHLNPCERARLSCVSTTLRLHMRPFVSSFDQLAIPVTDPSRYRHNPWLTIETPRVATLRSSNIVSIDTPSMKSMRDALNVAGERDAAWFVGVTRCLDKANARSVSICRHLDWNKLKAMMDWCSKHVRPFLTFQVKSTAEGDVDIIDGFIRRCEVLSVCGSVLEVNTKGGTTRLDSGSFTIGERLTSNIRDLHIENYDVTIEGDVNALCLFIGSSNMARLGFRNVMFTRAAWFLRIVEAAAAAPVLRSVSFVNILIEGLPMLESTHAARAVRALFKRIDVVEVDYLDVFDDDHVDQNDEGDDEEPNQVRVIIARRFGMSCSSLRCLTSRPFSNLQRLDVSYNKVRCIQCLVLFLDACPTLRSLRLRANLLSDTAFKPFGERLQVPTNLTFLDVSDNALTEASISLLVNTHVHHVIADANHIRTSLRHIHTITNASYVRRSVSLRGNPILRTPIDDVMDKLLQVRCVRIIR